MTENKYKIISTPNHQWPTITQLALDLLQHKLQELHVRYSKLTPFSSAPIVVFGSTGLLGNSVLSTLQMISMSLATGTTRNPRGSGAFFNVGSLDTLRQSLHHLIGQLPDGRSVVLNTLALSSPSQCKKNPQSVPLINIYFPAMLAEACAAYEKKEILMIHLASEVVYWFAADKSSETFNETTPLFIPEWSEHSSPSITYFLSKALGEKNLFIQAENIKNLKVISLRSSLLAGHDGRRDASIWQREVEAKIGNNLPVSVYNDQMRHLTSLEEAALGISNIALRYLAGESTLPKIVNFAAKDAISRLAMVEMIASVTGSNSPRIESVACPAEAFLRIPLDTNVSRLHGLALDLSPEQTIALTHFYNTAPTDR